MTGVCFHNKPMADCAYCSGRAPAPPALLPRWVCPSCGGRADRGQLCDRCTRRGWRAPPPVPSCPKEGSVIALLYRPDGRVAHLAEHRGCWEPLCRRLPRHDWVRPQPAGPLLLEDRRGRRAHLSHDRLDLPTCRRCVAIWRRRTAYVNDFITEDAP